MEDILKTVATAIVSAASAVTSFVADPSKLETLVDQGAEALSSMTERASEELGRIGRD